MKKAASPYAMAHHPFERHKRRHYMLVLIIIVAVLVAGAWVLYDKVLRKKDPEADKAEVLRRIAAESPLVSDEIKAPVLEALAKDNASLKISETDKEAALKELFQQ